jgi:ribosomal protein S18 acetylase RimI-like enzyme
MSLVNIKYQELQYDEDQILTLYSNNGWYAYTNDKQSLFEGIKQSTENFAAYHNQKLIGLIRVISDLHTICYIQDILVDKQYQRKGIGKKLMEYILQKYGHCRQIHLTTDQTIQQREFYQAIGFIPYEVKKCVGYMYNHKIKEK